MSDPKKIRQLLKSEEEKRAAAFEAQVLAELAQGQPAAAATPPPPSARPVADGIRISVTTNGQTTHYDNPAAVPAPVRQQLLTAWQPAVPPLLAPPGLPEPPLVGALRLGSGPAARGYPAAARPRSHRVAMTLNLFLPGAGQFYVGQPVAGSVYAFSFGACFVAILVVFLRDYSRYLQMSTGGDIFAGDNLERLTQSFHTGLIVGLTIVSLAVYLASAIHLSRTRAE